MSALGIYVALAVLLATLAAWIADRHGRNFWVYFVVCLVFPVAAFITIPYLTLFGGRAQDDAGPAPEAGDRVEQLERLARLHETGALTGAEYESEKARLLAS